MAMEGAKMWSWRKSATAKVVGIVGVIGTVLAVGFHGVFVETANDALKYFFKLPWASAASPPVVEKTANNQYRFFMHECKSADYSVSEFKDSGEARSKIEDALRTKGFFSVAKGTPKDYCPLPGLTVIATHEEDRAGAIEAASALEAIPSNHRPYGTVQINLGDEIHDLGVWFLMPPPPKKK
jgi:hypothetical protein